jgi:hypothetical protein
MSDSSGAIVTRVSIDWGFLRSRAYVLLIVIFIPLSLADVLASFQAGWLGTDAHLYYRASEAWLDGSNPWQVAVENQGSTYHYVALPTTTMLIAPFTALSESFFVPLWIGVQAAAGVYIVRRLRLPWWWLAFPPLVNGVLAGNPSSLVLALLLASSSVAASIGPLLKAYAFLPLIGATRWRAIAILVAGTAATLFIAPDLWTMFFSDAGVRTERLVKQSDGGFSAYGSPIILVAAVAALLVIARRDVRAAGWLAPIALWPGSQFHWSTLAMPVMTLPMAYLLALPAHGLPPIAVIVYALVDEARAWRARRSLESERSEFASRGTAEP